MSENTLLSTQILSSLSKEELKWAFEKVLGKLERIASSLETISAKLGYQRDDD